MKFTIDVPVDLYGVENTKLVTRELVTLQVKVLGDNLLQDVIVVDSFSEEWILGLDALYEHKFILDGSKRTNLPSQTTTEIGLRAHHYNKREDHDKVF